MRKTRRQSKTIRTKPNLLKPAFLAIVFAMAAAAIFMTIEASTTGAEISRLETEIANLVETNRALSAEIIRNSSVSSMDETAGSLGFAKPTKTFYLTPDARAFAKLP